MKKELKNKLKQLIFLCLLVLQRWLNFREPVVKPFGTTAKKELKKDVKTIKFFFSVVGSVEMA
jgi:hypothetical protein